MPDVPTPPTVESHRLHNMAWTSAPLRARVSDVRSDGPKNTTASDAAAAALSGTTSHGVGSEPPRPGCRGAQTRSVIAMTPLGPSSSPCAHCGKRTSFLVRWRTARRRALPRHAHHRHCSSQRYGLAPPPRRATGRRRRPSRAPWTRSGRRFQRRPSHPFAREGRSGRAATASTIRRGVRKL